jgi:phosphatidate cytidylyltransferase
MKRILTALVLIPLVLLAVFKAPSWLFTLLVGAVALLALKEYLDLVEAYGVKPIRWLSYAYLLFGFLVFELNAANYYVSLVLRSYVPMPMQGRIENAFVLTSLALCLLGPFFFLIAAMRVAELRQALPSSVLSALGPFYIGAPMLAVCFLQRNWYPLIFTFFAVWAGDIVAMYTGKAIGRHKMAPRISPNKTWEGAAGSVVGSLIACWLLTHFAPAINHVTYTDHGLAHYVSSWDYSRMVAGLLHGPMIFLFAIVLNIAAQLGDLVESLIKRGANVKDSGTMLPGHGGILDRIDALLFAAPVALVLFEFIR